MSLKLWLNNNTITTVVHRLARAGADPQKPVHLQLPPVPRGPRLPVLQEQHGHQYAVGCSDLVLFSILPYGGLS